MLGYAWNEADRLATELRARAPPRGRGSAVRRAPPARDVPARVPDPRAKEMADIPAMPPLYALEPGDTAIVAVPGSTDPEIVDFLDTLGLRPGRARRGAGEASRSTVRSCSGSTARSARSASTVANQVLRPEDPRDHWQTSKGITHESPVGRRRRLPETSSCMEVSGLILIGSALTALARDRRGLLPHARRARARMRARRRCRRSPRRSKKARWPT